MSRDIARRNFILVLGSGILGMSRDARAQSSSQASADVHKVLAGSSFGMAIYYFDPVALYIDPGQTVQWAGLGRRAVVAFHPSIDNHELRIPENAQPFDSKGKSVRGTFEWKFQLEGTYDYYAPSEEYLGMVGRIVVGKPGGPGEKPPGYGNREGRTVMYPDAARILEYVKSDEIVRKKSIPYPMQLLERKFPWR